MTCCSPTSALQVYLYSKFWLLSIGVHVHNLVSRSRPCHAEQCIGLGIVERQSVRVLHCFLRKPHRVSASPCIHFSQHPGKIFVGIERKSHIHVVNIAYQAICLLLCIFSSGAELGCALFCAVWWVLHRSHAHVALAVCPRPVFSF